MFFLLTVFLADCIELNKRLLSNQRECYTGVKIALLSEHGGEMLHLWFEDSQGEAGHASVGHTNMLFFVRGGQWGC